MLARLRSPSFLAVVPVLVVAIAFYAWTAGTSGGLQPGQRSDAYNLLVDGFLRGQTSMGIEAPAALLRLADPLDPAQNQRFVTPELRDLALYHGRLYSYWGAAPAIVLFLPFRALGAGDLSPGLAVVILAAVGLLASVALLRLLVAHLLPRTPPWMEGVAAAVLAFGNLAPWLARRPEAYEVAIAGGFAFFWAGLLALAAATLADAPRRRLLAAAGLLLGLAFASRPTMGIGFVLAAGVALWRWRAGRWGRDRLLALAVPAALVVAAVGAYNAARFSGPLDFGTSYVLGGERADRFGSLGYVAPGLWYYLLYPLRLRAEFPFLWVNIPHVPFPVPPTYTAAERTAGVLATTPFVAFLLLAPVAFRGAAVPLRRTAGVLTATAGALVLFTSYFYWGGVMRYEADFATLLILPAALAWFALARRPGLRRRARRSAAAAGVVLAAFGCAAGAATSLIGSDDRLRLLHPETFASLRDWFSPAAAVLAQAAGHPLLASIKGDPLLGGVRYDNLGIARADVFLGIAPMPIEIVSPDDGRGTLRATLRRTETTPANAKLVVQVTTEDGSVLAVPFRPGPLELPISMRRGVNDVYLQLFADPPTGIAEYPDAQDDGAIELRGLRLVG